jgi:hypothetical protein
VDLFSLLAKQGLAILIGFCAAVVVLPPPYSSTDFIFVFLRWVLVQTLFFRSKAELVSITSRTFLCSKESFFRSLVVAAVLKLSAPDFSATESLLSSSVSPFGLVRRECASLEARRADSVCCSRIRPARLCPSICSSLRVAACAASDFCAREFLLPRSRSPVPSYPSAVFSHRPIFRSARHQDWRISFSHLLVGLLILLAMDLLTLLLPDFRLLPIYHGLWDLAVSILTQLRKQRKLARFS